MSDITQIVHFSEFLKKDLGVSQAPFEAVLNYGYALLAIAGADGEVSEAELNWLINYHRMIGTSEEAIERYKTFDYKNANLEDLLAKITVDIPTWSKSRTLLYHGIQMARADNNYSHQEQNAVKKAAKLLNVEDDIVVALDKLVHTEEAVTALRTALLETPSSLKTRISEDSYK